MSLPSSSIGVLTAAQASFKNGINLLSDSKGALSWLMQGSTWKHGGKLPVGWFLTQWMQAEAASRGLYRH